MIDKLERIAAAGIQLVALPDADRHFVFEREGFVALVERRGDQFGTVGSAGILTERGFAALIWRGGRALFAAKSLERPATDEQVAALRRFQADLTAAING